jgi:hypothetical protein
VHSLKAEVHKTQLENRDLKS